MSQSNLYRNAKSLASIHAVAKVSFVILLLFGAVLRVWLCFHDDGIFWPDEIYQSLEPAHRLVFGYGLVPWEFIEGARNWTFPGIVAGLLRAVTWITGDHPRQYLVGVRFFFCVVGMVTAWGTYRLARTAGANTLGAALATIGFVLSPATIYFATRALSETASAAAVAFGLALTLRADVKIRTVAIGASLLGLAVLLRLQNGLFCLGLLGILLARKQWQRLGVCTIVLLFWAITYGALDRIIWGQWYHSVAEYLNFNVVQGKSAQWGTSEPMLYLRVLGSSMPLVMVWVAPLLFLAGRRATGLLLIAVGYVAIHSFVGHKEYRFLFPVLPLLFALGGVGFCVLIAKLPRLSTGLAIVMASGTVMSASAFHALTFGDLGQYGPSRAGESAYDDFGPINRLLLVAHDQPDLCGIAILAAPLAWTGGSTYLHRNVPIYAPGAWRDSRNFNYAVALGNAPGHVIATEGRYSLLALGQSSCVPDPNYNWKLP